MKNNLILTILALFTGMLMFQSCQQEPTFPDPGFEIGDQRVEVRRDTADFYDITMKMDVPNRVKTIELINASDYQLVEEIVGYSGQTKFDMIYQVDLTPFEKDTVLNYIIKVIDQDQRSFNQGIRLDVKGFSFPEIELVGGKNISVAAPAYIVKGLVSTGLNPLKSVKILFDDQEQYSFSAAESDTVLYELSIKEVVFLGELLDGVDYSIDIVIEDEVGQISTTTLTVRKSSEIKRPYRIHYNNRLGNLNKIPIEYNENGQITSFDYVFPNGSYNHVEFTYNDQNMVDTMSYKNIDTQGEFDSESFLYFKYLEGTQLLEEIQSQDFDYDQGNVSEGELKIEASDFVYDEEGKLLSYYTESQVENVYFSDPFGLGENVFGEYWQISSYMGSNTLRRQHKTEYDPVLMPVFMEGLPPYFMDKSIVLNLQDDLFSNKYVMTRTVPSDPNYASTYLREPSYSYETDTDGNITKITKIFTSGGYIYEGKIETYYFFYE